MGRFGTERVRRWVLLTAAIGLAVPITLTEAITDPDGTADAIPENSITIDLLADDFSIFGGYAGVLRLGGDVHWRNRSGETRTVTSPDGLLDSGPIPDGGSFHASLPVSGTYTWVSEFGEGTITVEADFTGSNDDRALDNIPDVAPPPRDPDDIGLHPELAIELPRSVAIIGFTETATVQEARQALGTSWDIIGGIPEFGLVYAKVWTTSRPSNFVVLDSRLATIRNHPAVEFASFDFITVDSVVAPPSSDADTVFTYWEPPATHPFGHRLNWGLELARVPQAWNLLDGARLSGAQDRGATVVVDSGFEAHVDLERLQILQPCTSWYGDEIYVGLLSRCTTDAPSDHGNHVAGIVGADFDGQGVTGIDPLSRLYGLPWIFEGGAVGVDGLDGSVPVALSLLFRELEGGSIPDVNVVNLSVQISPPAANDWWPAHPDDICGPGTDDDGGGTQACYPSIEDRLIAEHAQYGQLTRRMFEAFVKRLSDPPLFVNSTGNMSNRYCPQKTDACASGTTVPQSGEILSAETWANVNWDDSVGPNPIISVESIGNIVNGALTPQTDRSAFSNLDGDISTSGLTFSTQSTYDSGKGGLCDNGDLGRDAYCFQNGTSQAAPAIAGIAGLLAAWDPTLTNVQLKEQLLAWSIADTIDGASPRVDAFASLLSLPGAAKALVDVNDPSQDGNRRVIYDTDGTGVADEVLSTRPGFITEPDGVVDLADFRRFRDAWLQRCLISAEPGCPPAEEIDLDGALDHPKRDLNGDGCVLNLPPAANQLCPSELTFPRVDFNGDGAVSRNDVAVVPLELVSPSTNQWFPAATPADATAMTDLDVLASQWDATAPTTLGVTADELDGLLYSGDLVLLADDLGPAGADSVSVALVEHDTDQVVGGYDVVIGDPDDAVLTVRAGTSYRLDVDATGSAFACAHTIGPLSVKAGEDLAIDLSAALSVNVTPDSLRPGESADVLVTAASCSGDVEGLLVDVTLDPVGAGTAQLDVATVAIGANGTGSTSVSSGSLRSYYEISATADIPVGPATTASRAARTSFTVGEFYELELAAVDDATSGYAALDEWLALGVPVGPSVNGDGDVGFGALIDADDRYRVYVTQPGDDPTVPGDADEVAGSVIPADGRVTGEPELNDAGEIVFTTVRSESTDIYTGVYLSDGTTVTELATGLSTFGATTEPYREVERPTINENGRAIFVTTDQAGDTRLGELQGSLVVVGDVTFGARPQLADDGTSVAQATISRDCAAYPGVCTPPNTVILDPIILAGPDVQGTRVVVAEGRVDGFGALSDPDISPPGDVIAFVGDRDDTAGLFLSIRRANGSWQPPIAVEGPAAPGDLVALVRDRPTVAQIQGGGAGPAGDRVLVTVKGSESGAAGPAAEGVFVVPVDIVATGDPVTPYRTVTQRPQLVAQIGDPVDGKTIDRIELSDSLALATTPVFDGDHWVAFYAEATDGSNMHVRAHALAPPGAAAAPSGPGAGIKVIASRPAPAEVAPAMGPFVHEAVPARLLPVPQIDPDDVEVLPGPHIAAVTVDDDTPTARIPARIVNRSRAFDGTPAWAIADESGSNPTVLLNPAAIAPDGELLVTYPGRGTERLQVGSPLSSGGFANEVSFTVTVEPGSNRPPVGEITNGPWLVAPGQNVQLLASGNDPDGDRLSYHWDLDDDGDFDDSPTTFGAVNLTGDDVQAIVCGGSCVLEQPYPIKVQILDERGLDVVEQSTLTVSGLGDILLRLDPALVTGNPDTSVRTYAFVDKPLGDPSVPVQMSVEGAPVDWSISLTDEILSGASTQVSVRIPDDALEGSFSFDIVATAGDIERRATLTVVTLFGLIPECTATVQGRVTDELGNPIEGAELDPSMRFAPTVQTDASGDFSFDSILPRGATIEQFTYSLVGPSGDVVYLRLVGAGPHYARCDETTTVNPVMDIVPADSGLTMRAVAGIENPVNPTRPLATESPMDGVTFTIRYRPERFDIVEQQVTSGDGGAFFADLPTVSYSGSGMNYTIGAFKEGFWSISRSVRLTSLDEGMVIDAGDFPLIPACSGRVGSARVVDQFGEPVLNSQVWISSPRVGDFLFTDSDGMVTFDEEVFLATFNRSRSVTVRASAPVEWGNGDFDVESQLLEACGQVLEPFELELERPEPEVDYFGTLVGTVTDADTGDPIEGVSVNGSWAGVSIGAVTDANGDWTDEVFIGTDPADIALPNLSFSEWIDYWPESAQASVPVDSEVRVDVQLTKRAYVDLAGNITDAETGDPIEGAYVATAKTGRSGGGAVTDFTDPAGDFELPELELERGVPDGPFGGGAPHNGPRNVFVSASFDFFGGPDPEPYWPAFAETTISADGPNTVDLQMIPVCESASVSGIVVNAATLEPLEGVDILGWTPTTTDAQGRYEITGIEPRANNAPRTLRITARKEGFFDATVDVTTFCGAELIVDFGTPFGGFGTVSGTVTDVDTGDPIPDVFIGSTWGDSTTTDPDGTYSFDRAPLTSDGDPRDWTVSATRGFDRLQQVVTVSADADAVADFQFGVENLPPTAFGQALATDAETAIPVTLTGIDPEGEQLTFVVVDDPTLGVLAGDAPDLTYTPNGSAGDDSLTFTVSDGEHTSEPATITIDVTLEVNEPPVIAAPATVEVTAGESRGIGVSADDPDDDPLEFSLLDDAGGRASLDDRDDGTAVITVETDLADAGRTVEIEVDVSDGEFDDAATITVEIVAPEEPINRPPEISIDAPGRVDEGTRVTFDAGATTDPDGDEMTFAWTLVDFDGTPIATGSGAAWSYDFDDDFIGAARLLVTDDRGETAEAESEIIVDNVNPMVDAVVMDSTSRLVEGVEIDPGATVDVNGSFTDPGADEHQLIVNWGDGSSEAIAHQGGDFAVTHLYSVAGTFTLTVEVCDDDDGCGRDGDEVIVGDGGSLPPGGATTTIVDTAVTLPATGSSSGSQMSLAVVVIVLGSALLAIARSRRRRV